LAGGEAEFSVDYGSGIMSSNFLPANIGNTVGSDVNSRDEDAAGRALRLSGYANNGLDLTWMASTEGYDSIHIGFAARRTATGFMDNQFLYSIDSGATWTNFGDFFQPGTSFGLQSFDLGGIPGINDNADAGFRILFSNATSSSGNNRIDNLIVSGNPVAPPFPTPVPEPSTIALTIAGLTCAVLSRKMWINAPGVLQPGTWLRRWIGGRQYPRSRREGSPNC
jgi:hypothetical protein